MKSAHQRSLGTPTWVEFAPFQRKASSSGLLSPDFVGAASAVVLLRLLRTSLLTLLVVILPRLLDESTVLLTVGRKMSPGVCGV